MFHQEENIHKFTVPPPHDGERYVTSPFSMWGCVWKGCFERGIFWRARSCLKGIEDFNLELWAQSTNKLMPTIYCLRLEQGPWFRLHMLHIEIPKRRYTCCHDTIFVKFIRIQRKWILCGEICLRELPHVNVFVFECRKWMHTYAFPKTFCPIYCLCISQRT